MTPRSYGLENALAQYGCTVTLYSDRPVHGGLQSSSRSMSSSSADAAGSSLQELQQQQQGVAIGGAGGVDDAETEVAAASPQDGQVSRESQACSRDSLV